MPINASTVTRTKPRGGRLAEIGGQLSGCDGACMDSALRVVALHGGDRLREEQVVDRAEPSRQDAAF